MVGKIAAYYSLKQPAQKEHSVQMIEFRGYCDKRLAEIADPAAAIGRSFQKEAKILDRRDIATPI
jgi:hypothetical protein